MIRYGEPQTAHTTALHRSLYLAIIMDLFEGPHTALTIALHGGLYLAILMDRYEGPHTSPYYSLAYRPLISHYNGPL
jgi:hypothetical protein